MSTGKYEGLNLPQLLELMHPIVMPEPVSRLPATDGWWVLLGWIAAVTLLAAVKGVRRWRRDAYRREALQLIDQVDPAAENAAAAIAAIVKRTALAVYPREEVASRYGAAWAEFLVQSANDDAEVARAAGQIAAAAYRPGIADAELRGPARRWIRIHRA